jgi:predicted nuclease of predicted toxin-antitoxin system
VRFLVDENLPRSFVVAAEAARHSATWVRDADPGAPDVVILQRLMSSGETLVTRDIRFANLVLDQIALGRPLGGVVLIREQRIRELTKAWDRFLSEGRQPRGIAVVMTRSTRYREPQGQTDGA